MAELSNVNVPDQYFIICFYAQDIISMDIGLVLNYR